jgi:tol-pal system protein YbgF
MKIKILMRSCLPCLVLLTGCVSTSDIESIQSQLGDIQRQVLQLQQQSSSKEEVLNLKDQITSQTQSLLKSEADMQIGLKELSSQIDQLQANLEDTNYRLGQLSQVIASTNQELKIVRSNISGSGSGPTTRPGAGAQSSPETLYQSAHNDYIRGSYDLAIQSFKSYLELFPDTELADNAAYWIGECYFSQGKHSQAIRQFDNILNRYPRSDKLASALLKKGYAYLELNQRQQGVVQLRHVVREYPGTDEANLAIQRLRDLGIDVG